MCQPVDDGGFAGGPRVRKKLASRHLKIKRLGVEENFGEDIYHRLMRLSWSRFFLFFLLMYIGLNLFFAFLYWLSPGCVAEIAPGDFFSYFSFSVQTLSTIGYGHSYPVTAIRSHHCGIV